MVCKKAFWNLYHMLHEYGYEIARYPREELAKVMVMLNNFKLTLTGEAVQWMETLLRKTYSLEPKVGGTCTDELDEFEALRLYKEIIELQRSKAKLHEMKGFVRWTPELLKEFCAIAVPLLRDLNVRNYKAAILEQLRRRFPNIAHQITDIVVFNRLRNTLGRGITRIKTLINRHSTDKLYITPDLYPKFLANYAQRDMCAFIIQCYASETDPEPEQIAIIEKAMRKFKETNNSANVEMSSVESIVFEEDLNKEGPTLNPTAFEL